MTWLETIVLAVIQGVTEFLPVSSDGYLSVAGFLFEQWQPGGTEALGNLFYDVMLHVGTLAAILVFHRQIGRDGARGLLGAVDVPVDRQRPAVIRAGWLACVTILPLIPLALFLKDSIESLFGSPIAAAVGFLITAAELLLVSWLPEGKKTLSQTTWLDALLIGTGQAFAVLPGVSRSGTTIAIALALGFKRGWAVGFSLLIAIPAILGAAVLEVKDVDSSLLGMDLALKIVVGMLVAGLIGYLAILWLVKVVRSGRLWYFSVYLVILAGVLISSTLAWPDSSASRGEG